MKQTEQGARPSAAAPCGVNKVRTYSISDDLYILPWWGSISMEFNPHLNWTPLVL